MLNDSPARVLRSSRIRKYLSYSLFVSLLTFIAPIAISPVTSVLLPTASASGSNANAPDAHQLPNQIIENAYVGGGYTYNANNPPTINSALGTQCVFNSAVGGGAAGTSSVGESAPYMEWRFTPTVNAAPGCSPTLSATPTSTTGMLVHYTSYIYTALTTMQMCEVSNSPMYATVNGALMLNDWANTKLPSSNSTRVAAVYNQDGSPAMPTSGTQTNAWWSQQSTITTTASTGAGSGKTLASPWAHGQELLMESCQHVRSGM